MPADAEPDRRGDQIGDRQVTATLVASVVTAPNLMPRNDLRSAFAGLLTSLLGAGGVWAGVLGMFGSVRAVRIGWLLPLSGVQLGLDPLGGFFMTLTGAVAVASGSTSIGYARREHLGRVTLAVLPIFVTAMLLVPAAASVTTFLLAWELMAVASLVLVLADHTRPQVRSAALVYAVMTQLGFVGDPGRADGVVGGRRRRPVRRLAPDTAGCAAPRSFC